MRTWHRAAVVAAALLVTGSLTGAVAQATSSDTIYVGGNGCDDSSPNRGSQTTPFCHLQSALDVVEPGQTVLVASGWGSGPVTLTRSGTAEAPITITSPKSANGSLTQIALSSADVHTAALALSGVSHVHISSFQVRYVPLNDGVIVANSHDITVDRLYIAEDNLATTPTASDDRGVAVDGASSNITVSRSKIFPVRGDGVRVEPGAAGITVTTNYIATGMNGVGGVRVSGASAAVTSNTIATSCASSIGIDGGSTAMVENNYVAAVVAFSMCGANSTAGIEVAPDSTATVRADYNAPVESASSTVGYLWGGTTYTSATAFAASTGQGVHDIDARSKPLPTTPTEGSPLIDSADSSAPGELATDLNGNPRVDDLLVPNTGVGYADRGAFEQQYQLTLTQEVSSPTREIAPLDVSVQARPTNAADGWSGHITFVFDFGDGSTPVVNTTGVAGHTYTKPGVYTEVTTATVETDGSVATSSQVFVAGTDAGPTVGISTGPVYDTWQQGVQVFVPDCVSFTMSSSAAWEVASFRLDFGDGTVAEYDNTTTTVPHHYDKPGLHHVVVTQTDLFGRTSTATTAAVSGDVFMTWGTGRVYDSRTTGKQVPAHGVVKLSLKDLKANYADVDAATVTVTVTHPKKGGYVGVFPDGNVAGQTSNVNFAAGQTVANEANAIPGPNGIVDFYNGSDGPIDLIVDTFGTQRGRGGSTYTPVNPVRVLDTRDGTGAAKGAVRGHSAVTFQAAGKNGVPADAAAVVLNVAATHTQTAGYVTAYGDGSAKPNTSNANWAAGQTVSSLVVVPLSTDSGKVTLYNGGDGSTEFAADLVGYYSGDLHASFFVPSSPARLLDTRAGTGTGGAVAKLGPGQTLTLQVAGVGGVPDPVSALVANLTVTRGTAAGYLTVWPHGAPRSTTSSLNFAAGQTVANMAIAPVGVDGAIDIYNGSSAAVDVIVDDYGFYYSYPTQ